MYNSSLQQAWCNIRLNRLKRPVGLTPMTMSHYFNTHNYDLTLLNKCQTYTWDNLGSDLRLIIALFVAGTVRPCHRNKMVVWSLSRIYITLPLPFRLTPPLLRAGGVPRSVTMLLDNTKISPDWCQDYFY